MTDLGHLLWISALVTGVAMLLVAVLDEALGEDDQ